MLPDEACGAAHLGPVVGGGRLPRVVDREFPAVTNSQVLDQTTSVSGSAHSHFSSEALRLKLLRHRSTEDLAVGLQLLSLLEEAINADVAVIELELEQLQPQAPAGQQPQQSKRVSLAQRSTESRTAPYAGVLRGRGYAVHFFSRPLKTSKFVNAPLTEQICECRMRVRGQVANL